MNDRFSLISPKVDLAFKKIFARPDHPEPLRQLLNAIFSTCGAQTLASIEILNPQIDPQYPDNKSIVLDIRARTERNALINIEMQMVNHYDWAARSLYYWSRLFDEQLNKGEDYHLLKPVISVSLLNFVLFPERTDRMHSVYELNEKWDHHTLTSLMQMVFVELVKPVKVSESLENWIRLFNAETREELDALPKDDIALQEAIEMIDRLSQTPSEKEMIENRRRALLDYNTDMRGAREEGLEEGLEKGRAEGRAQGLAEGIEQGIEQGIEKGHLEGKVNSLLVVAQARFGPLPEWAKDRIAQANEAELDRWLKNIFNDESLENLLK